MPLFFRRVVGVEPRTGTADLRLDRVRRLRLCRRGAVGADRARRDGGGVAALPHPVRRRAATDCGRPARAARGGEPVRAAGRQLAAEQLHAGLRAGVSVHLRRGQPARHPLCRHGTRRRMPAPGPRQAAVRGRQADADPERGVAFCSAFRDNLNAAAGAFAARSTPRACWRRRRRTSPSHPAAPRGCAASGS